MATKTINDLPELTSVASGDFVAGWDISGVATMKMTIANIFNLLLTQANTFSAAVTIQPASLGSHGLIINQPTGTTNLGLRVQLNGANYFYLLYPGHVSAASSAVVIPAVDGGNNALGPYVEIGRNTNGTKPGSGFVRLTARTGTTYRVWPDNTGVLRIHTADPIYDNDVLGTVVGAQTSSLDAKKLLGVPVSPDEALASVCTSAEQAIKRFVYKNGAFDGEEFSGLVVDFAPRYGMDRDEAHPHGKALNVINAVGDLMLAVKALNDRLDKMEMING